MAPFATRRQTARNGGTMVVVSDRRATVVGWLKLILPLAAIGLLSTLFLVSERIDPSRAFTFAQVDVEALAREQRIDMPRYAGMTEDGAALMITARDVRSDPLAERRIAARELIVVIETPDGAQNRILADFGQIDRGEDALRLSGNVSMTTAAGYVVESEALFARLDRTYLESPSAVTTQMPGAMLDAGAMRLTLEPAAGEPGKYVLVFTGGVRMLYAPELKE